MSEKNAQRALESRFREPNGLEQDFGDSSGDSGELLAAVVGDGEAQGLPAQGHLERFVDPRAFAGNLFKNEFGALLAFVESVIAPEQRCFGFSAEVNPYACNPCIRIDGNLLDFAEAQDGFVLADKGLDGPVSEVAEYRHKRYEVWGRVSDETL